MAYIISDKGKYLHIDWHEVFTPDDLGAVRRELPQWAKKLGYAPNVLHTFDRVTGGTIQPIAVLDHSIQRKATPFANRAKSAAVAKTDEVRNMAALFVELNRNPNLDMRIFDTDEEAIAWLRE